MPSAKISEQAHTELKRMAAASDCTVGQVIDTLLLLSDAVVDAAIDQYAASLDGPTDPGPVDGARLPSAGEPAPPINPHIDPAYADRLLEYETNADGDVGQGDPALTCDHPVSRRIGEWCLCGDPLPAELLDDDEFDPQAEARRDFESRMP